MATTDKAGQPPYWLDSIRCLDTPITTNTSGRFEFEERFVPPEVSGTFVIDNSQNQNTGGGLSTHAPLLGDSGTAEFKFSCSDKPHTQMSFWYAGINPAAGQTLKFYIDDVLYQTYGRTSYDGWTQVTGPLGTGAATHKYKWEATTSAAGQPPYWLDGIRCQ